MSYRGRPSKGCDGCRTRKIKCDETKPICNRCNKTGSECRYRDQADIFFKNQTASAAQRAESSWRKRSKSQAQARSASVSRDDEAPALPEQATVHKPSLPELHLEQMAIASVPSEDPRRLAYDRLIYDFVAPETTGRAPHEPPDSLYAFMPALYEKTSSGSCLATIVDALAYTNFANRHNVPQMAIIGAELIGKGIKMLSKIIKDHRLVATDETLCSVYLMTVYENIASLRELDSFTAHQAGANALLQLRSIETFHDDVTSAKLYEVSYLQMLLQNLQTANRPPIPVDTVAKVSGSKQNAYTDSDTRVMELAFKVAILHAKWYEVKCGNGPPSHRVDLRELLAEALEIDDEFQIYTAIIPQGWRHHVQANTPAAQAVYTKLLQKLILQGSGAPRVIHSYANVKRCWMSNFHQTSRMFLLRDVLEILNWMLRMPESGPSPIGNGSEQIEMTGGLDAGHINDLQPQLDDKTLCMRHASVTNDLANLIEDGCAAIISGFAVNIPGRSVEDISTVRGYIAMWKMGTMDAILKAGLIPDANLPISPPPDSISLGRPEHKQTPVFDPSLPVHHIFDYRPKHPYDFPVDLPYVDNDCTDTIKIDLVARRLWINRILYYIGKELGVSKALAVWYIEGLTNVKMEVDAILGKA